jgi:hypothetical protein
VWTCTWRTRTALGRMVGTSMPTGRFGDGCPKGIDLRHHIQHDLDAICDVLPTPPLPEVRRVSWRL